MKKHYKTLIVEDHAFTASGIKGTLDKISKSTGTEFTTHIAHNLVDALAALKTKPSFDLVFLDIRLEPQPEIEMYSGEDLGVVIRKRYPGTIIIVSTVHNTPHQIGSILNNVDPDGFFVKGDIDSFGLEPVINKALHSPPQYSSTVLNFMRKLKNEKNLKMDDRDRQLLFELDKGHTMDKIAEIMPLSRSAIAKRIQKLKRIFDLEGSSTRYLIRVAREKGVI